MTNPGVGRASAELRVVLRQAVGQLEAANVPSAALTAELLLMHVLQCDRTWLYAHPEHELRPAQSAAYAQLVERRSKGVPTQYLTGRQEFWGLEFEVGPGVLIPRPETEHVIEVALERLGARRMEPLRIADVGTGSGCIAVALAREFPQAHVIATDISAAALGYARRNAARHGVAGRIQFLQANLLEGCHPEEVRPHVYMRVNTRGPQQAPPLCVLGWGEGSAFDFSGVSPRRFDLVASNPPYVGREDAASLPREVREHEPPEALFAGETGVDIYPTLIEQASKLLSPDGILVAEIGYNGADYVRSLLSVPPWSEPVVTRDLAGIERVISARLSA